VISTCVALTSDLSQERLSAALDEATAFVEANFTAPYPLDLFGDPPTQFAQAAAQIAPVILEALVEPQALGIQLFCVTDASGVCPSAPPPAAPPAAPPATPVAGVRPNFTG
jgi:hypothetical protein